MLEWNEIALRLLLACLFGAFIGLERERKEWTAGLRTHMMVCVGSCLIMLVSIYGFSDVLGNDYITLDPSRVAAQVVSGIGFIGAGTILFLKPGTIRGLTTASGLWTVAAIGLATGGGMYFAAGITTLMAIIILWALNPLVKKFSKKFKYKTLHIVTTENNAHLISEYISAQNLDIHSFTLEKNNDKFEYFVNFEELNMKKVHIIIDALNNEPTVKGITWS